jgi:hypothetical protein
VGGRGSKIEEVGSHAAPLGPMLEEPNDGSEHVYVGIVGVLAGKQGGDGVGHTQAVDGGFAALFHVFEKCV